MSEFSGTDGKNGGKPHSQPRDRWRDRLRGLWPFRSLLARIISLNAVALTVLAGGVLSLGQFKTSLVEARIQGLLTQGRIIADAMGESATTGPVNTRLVPQNAASILARLVVPTETRARLFLPRGMLIVDTRSLRPDLIESYQLPPPEDANIFMEFTGWIYDQLLELTTGGGDYPLYVEPMQQTAQDYLEVDRALRGMVASTIRSDGDGGLIVSVAVPVQRFRRVVGALMLTTETSDIEQLIRDERQLIVQVSLIAFFVAVLLSFLLARTIARPVHRLAEAAEQVRTGVGKRVEVPDFTRRRDEIGNLSQALRAMTDSLYDRLEATEAFAADVAHELKNPLTSLRSAVEVVARVQDPDQQRKLMDIILKDVDRLNRLITDISDASRIDAELARADLTDVNFEQLVQMICSYYADRGDDPRANIDLKVEGEEFQVLCVGERIGQVVRNLIDNALSFSPQGGTVWITLTRDEGWIRLQVDDEGIGIPSQKLEAVFDRFYSDRPAGEAFGQHSGLGLSISRQIAEAHEGKLFAENRLADDGSVNGARFTLLLPAKES